MKSIAEPNEEKWAKLAATGAAPGGRAAPVAAKSKNQKNSSKLKEKKEENQMKDWR